MMYRGYRYGAEQFNGHYCAYIEVPPGHPWHGRSYDEVESTTPHGDFTYEGWGIPPILKHSFRTDDDSFWLGWDYAHFGDYFIEGLDITGKKWTRAEVEAHARAVIDEAIEAHAGAAK